MRDWAKLLQRGMSGQHMTSDPAPSLVVHSTRLQSLLSLDAVDCHSSSPFFNPTSQFVPRTLTVCGNLIYRGFALAEFTANAQRLRSLKEAGVFFERGKHGTGII
jgi:hypothetical protein